MKLPNGFGSVTKLTGKRRNPYWVRITEGFHYDKEKDKQVQNYLTLGYVKTRAEGIEMLVEYHNNPFDVSTAKITFAEIFEKWSKTKFPTVSKSNINGYTAAYKLCGVIYKRPFRELRLADLQGIVDTCGKNYPTLRKLKVLFKQMFDYAMKNDICNKDYAQYVDIIKYRDRNPNKYDRNKYAKADIKRFWTLADDKYYQAVLMLIYTGLRIAEFLALKKENINLEKQYFDVISSKTDNGIRKVPIADKILPFFENWYHSSDSEHLIHNEEGQPFKYRNYYDSYFIPLMQNLGLKQTPHCCRHTCISMLAEAKVDQTTIKKIVGHSGAMTLTEKVYTHLDIEELLNAINKI